MKSKNSDDVATLIAIGVLVSVAASLAHEALGHGVGCAIGGGHITLLTFLVFRCAGAGVLADGGGPVGVLLIGCVALLVAFAANRVAPGVRLFLFVLGAMGLLWFWGQLIREAIDGSDDWGHVAADLHWSAGWHPVALSVGLIGYIVTTRVSLRIGGQLASGRPMRLLVPYLAAVMSAVLLAAIWHGDRMGSALDALLAFGVAPFGYLLVIRRVAQGVPVSGAIERNPILLGSIAVVWGTFALTIARGVGRLS